MSVGLTVVISLCICILNHHVVQLKYIVFIKKKKKKAEWVNVIS